jgi:hypothetical protein
MRPPTPNELQELNQATAHLHWPQAAFNDGKVLDFVAEGKDKAFVGCVRTLGSAIEKQANSLAGLGETIAVLEVPIDLEHLWAVCNTLQAYAETLRGYMLVDQTGTVCLS